jgi:hypothetical protein
MPRMRKCYLAVLTTVLIPNLAQPARSQDPNWPDWKKHSYWCAHDHGSSGGAYQSTCVNHDQFDSVVACQTDSKGSQGDSTQAVQAAGRDAVNQFMDAYKPTTCQKTQPHNSALSVTGNSSTLNLK